ncbi:MAG: GntR family transcriptional regulator [Anaerolineales bacterium]|nr:GntR family transcriptional regulator [Anaerolineales bacterium]
MDRSYLYYQIAETIRQDIRNEVLRPGDRLPSVREMAARWNCTIGTIQRAYEELAHQGLVTSRPGQGTHVMAAIPATLETPLRRAALVHRAEAFLLEALTAGYTPLEAEQAVRIALDRWRTLNHTHVQLSEQRLRFVGSHDPAVTLIAARFADFAPGETPQLTFTGSLGGLIALAEGEADLAGCHLWDEESDSYNIPFVRRLLPGQRVALLTLAHRRLGFIVSTANPMVVSTLEELAYSGLRFINRQRGAGTRVWLDAHLHQLGIAPEQLPGYEQEKSTHSEVAQMIAEGQADVGLGVEAAALAFGLRFIPLTLERYDLVIPAEVWGASPVQALAHWLATDAAKAEMIALGGYEVRETGRVQWVE